MFDNNQEYLDLSGTARIIPELAQVRISTQRLVPDVIAPFPKGIPILRDRSEPKANKYPIKKARCTLQRAFDLVGYFCVSGRSPMCRLTSLYSK
jgi:hypothetical protein